MTYIPPNQNGQASSAASAPIVIAFDQSDINVSERHLVLLTRIAKALEGCSTIDANQRLRITIDNITAALTLSTITTVGTVNTLTTVTNAVPVGNVATIALMGDEQFINIARQTYSTGIRSRLN